jgi:hypothetical protein
VNTLKNIAIECPKYNGHGVYRARGLLDGCNKDVWSDNYADCHPIAPPMQEQLLDNQFGQRSDKKELSTGSTAYPNPTTDGIFIHTISGSEGQIILYDLMGKICKQTAFASEEEVKYINLNDLPNGVYNCSVFSTNGEYQVFKIFVIKP